MLARARNTIAHEIWRRREIESADCRINIARSIQTRFFIKMKKRHESNSIGIGSRVYQWFSKKIKFKIENKTKTNPMRERTKKNTPVIYIISFVHPQSYLFTKCRWMFAFHSKKKLAPNRFCICIANHKIKSITYRVCKWWLLACLSMDFLLTYHSGQTNQQEIQRDKKYILILFIDSKKVCSKVFIRSIIFKWRNFYSIKSQRKCVQMLVNFHFLSSLAFILRISFDANRSIY